jgi:hypothetical protein
VAEPDAIPDPIEVRVPVKQVQIDLKNHLQRHSMAQFMSWEQ